MSQETVFHGTTTVKTPKRLSVGSYTEEPVNVEFKTCEVNAKICLLGTTVTSAAEYLI